MTLPNIEAKPAPKPLWIRVKAPTSPEYQATRRLMRELKLNTVCEEAACPNIGECWSQKHATVMIMGDTCTRACAFCNVKTGMPGALRGRAGTCRGGHLQARADPCRGDLGRSRRSRRRRRGAFCADNPGDSRALPDHDHRDPDARLPAQGRRARSGGGGQ